MQYKNSIPALIVLVALTSCGNSSADEKTGPVSDTSAKPAATTVPATTSQPGNVSVLPASPASPAAVNKAGLNPEHGKPGHRCDIAVGAPLDSKPTTPSAAPVTVSSTPATTPTNNVTVNPATTTTPAATAPGMNPAHGQPGHRCDIAVGAPLNSKPVAQATTTQPLSLQPSVPAATPIVTPTAAPAAKATTAPVTPTATAPGMNPPHGQPGHRCDIAVGSPLNSQPKKN